MTAGLDSEMLIPSGPAPHPDGSCLVSVFKASCLRTLRRRAVKCLLLTDAIPNTFPADTKDQSQGRSCSWSTSSAHTEKEQAPQVEQPQGDTT